MKTMTSLAALAATLTLAFSPALAQSRSDEARFQAAQQRFASELGVFQQEFDRYQQARARGGQYGGPRGEGYYNGNPGPGPGAYNDDRYENGYDASRYYRDDARYQERVLAADDRVYRGNDGRYYCKRSDGTTGLILGAAGGGILGNIIDGGHSRAAGTLIGGALGALAGKSIDQNNAQLRCR